MTFSSWPRRWPITARRSKKALRGKFGDLLIGLAGIPHPGTRIGFALEPAADLLRNARSKMEQKSLAAIVANPLETMESETIDGVLIDADGCEQRPGDGPIGKKAFATWLIDRIIDLHQRTRRTTIGD
jgi:phosphopantothenoylcysteine synthetase/decarboxylase